MFQCKLPRTNNSLIAGPTIFNNSSAAAQSVLDDTFLAAMLSSNGNRYIFFQDGRGLIRHAVLAASTGQWITSPRYHVTPDARDHTPLAAASIILSKGGIEQVWMLLQSCPAPLRAYMVQIILYFILNSHSIITSYYTQGFWIADSIGNLGNHTTTVKSRQLSFTSIATTKIIVELSANIATRNLTLLFYEILDVNVTVLLNYVAYCNESSRATIDNEWIDISSRKTSSIPPLHLLNHEDALNPQQENISTTFYESAAGFILETSFACGRDLQANETDLTVQALLCYPPISKVPRNRWGTVYDP